MAKINNQKIKIYKIIIQKKKNIKISNKAKKIIKRLKKK